MGKESLPLVFGAGKLQYTKVPQWYEQLLANKDAYKDCFIPTFTRVKNLGSKYMHEYCQFIVEDRSTGERARVYAERANDEDVDVISVGRDEKAPRDWDELPLPLTSLSYDDRLKQPSLFDVAKILYSVSIVGGKYNFYDKNCFWYAFTTFDTLRLALPATLKNWLWVNPGGKGGGSVGDAWGIGFPTMFKYFFKSSAKAFEKERTDNLSWLQPSDFRTQVTPEAFMTELTSHLLEPEAAQAYFVWAKTAGLKVIRDDLNNIVKNVEAKVKNLDQQGSIAWTQEFDTATRDMIRKLEKDPEGEKYLQIYHTQPKAGYLDIDIGSGQTPTEDPDSTLDAVTGQTVSNPTEKSLIVKDNADEELANALRTLVGAALLESGFNKR